MAQQEITKFFYTKRKMSREGKGTGEEKRISVRPMSELCKTPEKIQRRGPAPSPRLGDSISLLSSDEDRDQENCVLLNKTTPGAGADAPTYSKASCIPTKRDARQQTPNNKSRAPTSASNDRSPSKITFYSPTKKRSVKKSSPNKRALSRAHAATATAKKLFVGDDEEVYSAACAGQDDKTKFLLRIVHEFVKDESEWYLLGEEGRELLQRYLRVRGAGAQLVCRLYWRKARWHRRAELLAIVGGGKDASADGDMFKELLDKGFLVRGSSDNMEFDDYTDDLLKLEDLKNICKYLKIKSQSKKDSIDLLQSYCRSSNITNYFGVSRRNAAGTNNSNTERVLNMLRKAAGECYKLSGECREVLYRLHLLSYLGLDPEVLRTRQLELHLVNVKTGRETFPIDPSTPLDKPSLVFPTRQHFDNYMIAHYLYEDFLQTADAKKKISIVQQAHNLYKDLQIEQFRTVQPWLRKFTPAYLHIKIIEEGLPEVKKGKDETLCREAVEMLSSLLSQDLFRQHRCANWYDEKALILHNYLHQPDQAAHVLLVALSSDLSEEAKDLLRPRAKKLAAQKNISLDDKLRSVLLGHGTKDYILESSLPSVHFYRQPMDNTTKGKVLFESRNENGRTISSVENVAIECYLESGEYTHGQHWEGRIVTTLFFLLFWDIIYSKPKDARGIFLCHYQRYPLDMLCETFYQSRKSAIDERLKFIETSAIDDVVQMMSSTWNLRPEGEHGGVTRELRWECVAAVARCLRPAALAALCRRLAHHYRYAHSGFPDLTLWNPASGKIKFAEVKSDSDKPSMKQIQWMQYLLASGVDTEFCYVGARGIHASVKTSALNLLQQVRGAI